MRANIRDRRSQHLLEPCRKLPPNSMPMMRNGRG
jgi:hypothetical protein